MKKKRCSIPIWRDSLRKLWIMTRFLFIFVFVASLHVSAALHSQNKMVTLHLKGVSLEEVIQSLKLQTDYGFFYNIDSKDIKKMTNISVDVKNMALEDVLLQILKGTNLTYSIVNDVVILNTRNSIVVNDSVRKNHVLVGRVMDMNKEPLPGVTVRLENTSMGTATNFEGVFSFRLPVEKGKLILSFVGFKTKGVEFKLPSDTLKIVLEEEVENVEEVVVTGYFNKAKESFTGSEVTIETEELKKVGALSITQALSAFDPSIRLAESLTNGSNPNVLPDITIRGENGFDLRANADDATTNPNAPLYILDGVEVSAERVYDMDVNRVESITILKDASATALYGSRASNGVIVITTIRPKSGQIRVSLNANYNISVPDLRDYNLMNAEEKLEYERLAGLYQDTDYLEQCKLDELYNSRLEEVRKGVNTYWLSQPLTTSLNQRYSINFEGGDEYFRYGIDLRYDTDKGVMKQSGRDRLGINLTFNYNIGTNFFIRNDLAVDNVKAKNSPYNEFYLYANQNPYDRIYDENGKFVEKLSSGDWNPLYNAHLAKKNTSTYTSIQDNFNIDWRIIPALRLQGRISYTRQFDKRDLFKSPESLDYSTETDPKKKGTYFRSNSQSDKFDGNLTLQYNKVLGVHSLNVGVGSNLTESTEEGDSYTGVGFVNPNMIFIGAATSFKENSSPDGSYDKSRLVGFFGNVNYGYDNRYFLDLSFRTDGSSKFGRNSRFAPFWSVGVAWNVHKEAFWSGDEKSSLKLRASVGSTGTTNFSSTQALTTYNYDFSKIYNGVFGVSLAGYGNPELKWQNTISYNVGVDMTLLKGLVTFNGDFYIKNTENLLLPLTVAPSTGFSSYVENIGKLRNTGIEGRLRLNLIRDTQRDLRWNVTLSAFHNKSKITKLSNQLEEINKYANSDWYNQGTVVYRQYEAGRSQTALMMVRSGGIDPATGNEVYIKRNGELTFEYDANDKVKCGDMKPTIEGNVNTNLTWKGFTLYMLFKYQFGAKAYNGTLASKVEGANPYKNADKRVLYDRWKEPGDHAKFRRIDDRTSPYQTTRLVFDNDLFSLSSVSLSYELPRDISQKIYADRVRLMLSTTDVFRLSTIKQERGTSYPFARTFNLSLNVTF
ncbi:MAG TPA: SusC/RagA family TonB-linked outer membrane protein [Butyricimonas sp.]|uniref:SusC/RagA family TonB-linked outer membrane protein n=3 Tax=Odoribacteraceae TaxID=1853231 RepID=A0A415QLG0_9BACT|nr:SusC/RagA family TonB-linked outer membrane protein [Butyricimonas virosa]HAM83110.1 SusC/RagA family TonB-linked outer membrane protein [Butyricimonas sp.]HCH89608.1 SusC/RagA family TonB-linked outer membrane protein [Butyricimonas sp.]